ncbi:hypothetical protein GWK47_033487 [Chionoecetes opilio]|uniref:Uncharacterized protein n=1 Tax=Chionoecetes opilio TaxID=41210 RepID=A0A8J4YPN6_CHIOP|nr:hypothetical protein GWK47_033487 [Chionoecetes opilio]
MSAEILADPLACSPSPRALPSADKVEEEEPSSPKATKTPGKKTEEELQEEEELQLALALSKSEAENKEKETQMHSLRSGEPLAAHSTPSVLSRDRSPVMTS